MGRPGRDGGHLGAGRWDAPGRPRLARGRSGRRRWARPGPGRWPVPSPAGANTAAALGPRRLVHWVRGMSLTRKKGFYKQDINKTAWELPKTYLSPTHVGSGAYGAVW